MCTQHHGHPAPEIYYASRFVRHPIPPQSLALKNTTVYYFIAHHHGVPDTALMLVRVEGLAPALVKIAVGE
eukprot:SAG11_NODE_11436_length_761_cov_0.808157_1_plen_70_part_10